MGIKEQLQKDMAKVGRIARGGWGDKIAIGVLIGYLEPITPQQVYEYISSQSNLFDNLSEEDWENYRELIQGINLSSLDTPRLLLELKKRRQDLLQIITNTPGGMEWVNNEVKGLRDNLGILTI